MTDVEGAPSRAGFWRRSLALCIDYLVMFVPLYLVVAALFSQTNGAVQGNFFLKLGACYETSVDWASTPPAGIDAWQVCRTSILGVTTAIQLVGKNTENGTGITFPVDASGQLRDNVFDAGILEPLILFVFLFSMEWRTGWTFGKRCVTIVVKDVDDERRVSLPVNKAFRRQFVKAAGLLPMIVLQIAYVIAEWMGSVPTEGELQTQVWLVASVASIAIAIAWFVWIAVSIMFGRDPIHDRFAATTVRMNIA
ncbi:RDD family protein [Aminobacter niigataensis]|uniref:RDD family protein n=1 Tax=Aminobacter niigataensis TaxID=83265 RepID=UPI0024CB5059|nr:RDD family protein [Aminobacter niigataensis]CAI2932716.1 RDD domain-containing protein [Aminobacter niigataensis]